MRQRQRIWGAGPLQTKPTASISLPPLFCSSFHPTHSLTLSRNKDSSTLNSALKPTHFSVFVDYKEKPWPSLCSTEQRASLPQKVVVFLHDLMFALWNKAPSNLKRKNDSPHKTIMQYFFTQNFHKVSISQ